MGNKQTAFSEEQLDAYQVRNAAQKNDVCFNAPLLTWFTGYIYARVATVRTVESGFVTA